MGLWIGSLENKIIMKILVTGNLGYIGPILGKFLKTESDNIELIGVDTGFFQPILIDPYLNYDFYYDKQLYKDVRDIKSSDLESIDAVIHLAAVSNDPMGKLFEDATKDINHKASVELALKAKKNGVKNFVFASSCSVYGSGGDNAKKEDDTLNPLTAYANSKIDTENDLSELADDNFLVTCFRFATACGYSPRIRLDLVLNDFVTSAISTGRIEILSDGSPLRPLIDVEDMSRALYFGCIRNMDSGGSLLICNAGSNEWNYNILELAHKVKSIIGSVDISVNQNAEPDKRSYKVDFSKFNSLAPNHVPRKKIENSINEIYELVLPHKELLSSFRDSDFIRLNVLRNLVSKRLLNYNLQRI